MVPGSTLMYGSSFIIVTRRPRASRMAASEAEAMPFPSEDTTPPVTKIRGVMTQHNSDAGKGIVYRLGRHRASRVRRRTRLQVSECAQIDAHSALLYTRNAP